MKKFTKTLLVSAALVLTSAVYAQHLPTSNNRPLMPKSSLFGEGEYFRYHVPATKRGRVLETREPNSAEGRAIEDIQRQFEGLSSVAYLLGDGDKIVKVGYKDGASEHSTFMSASVDKTVTAMSAGVAVCDGKISLNTKAKDVLPELQGTDIGESTLRDNLTMSSGVTRAFDDSQSLTREERQELYTARTSWMELLKGRLGKQQGWQKPGDTFSYKSQDPVLVAMMVSAAYGKGGKDFREWQTEHFFSKVGTGDRRYHGRDRFGYAWSVGDSRMTMNDWARFAVFVQESRKEPGCYGDFVREATTRQIRTDRRFVPSYHGYGYFTWVDSAQIPGTYAAIGYGGQTIIWNTKNDKFFIAFSTNAIMPELHGMAKLWFERN